MTFWQHTDASDEEIFGCHVVSAGYAEAPAFNADCARFRSDYQIIYLREGKGKVRLNGEWHRIGANTLLFYRPMEYQEYKFPQSKDIELYWVYFKNTVGDEITRRLGIPSGNIFSLEHDEDIIADFNNILREMGAQGAHKQLLLSLYMGELLVHTARGVIADLPKRADGKAEAKDAVAEVLRDIEKNYMAYVNVGEYASRCGFSTTYFTRIFFELTGMTPIAYRRKIRIEKAACMLRETDKTVQDIALEVGFRDSLYFSKAFREIVGVAPTVYRKIEKI